ncbi:MFS transporter [Paenibacillus sp. SC116]|uniref:MFS transporter n=1 Tax=Paenibacillus sp. SC116 TaxID=2968986 RepID=UPI00215AB0FC|nr:MFS transporter [Paenibacillus sp. SC116]MCR8844318.1 MFS transporter [Paenibacillus sp. SC116]
MTSKRTRNWILALLFLGWSLGNLDRYIMNYAVLAITEDLNLSSSSTGILLSSFFAGYALMQMPGGWLADRFGPRKVLLSAVVIWSIFTGLTAVAWSLTSMIIIRFLFGIGEGGFQPASSKILSLTFPKAERARAMSVILSSSGIISLFIPLAAAGMLETIGWRTMFVIFGLAGVVIAVLYWFFIKIPNHPLEDEIVKTTIPTTTMNPQQNKGMFKALLKTPIIWNLLVAYFSIYAVNWGLSAWLPTYLVKSRGLDLVSVGWAQTIPAVTTIVGIFISGYVIDKLPKGKERLLGSVSCACIGVLLYLMFTASSVSAFIAYQTTVNLFIAFVVTLLPAIVLKQLPTSVTGTAMGIANTGGQLAGFITPMAIGFMVDAFNGSFDAAFWMLIAFSVVCIGALMTMNDKKGELFKQNEEEVYS